MTCRYHSWGTGSRHEESDLLLNAIPVLAQDYSEQPQGRQRGDRTNSSGDGSEADNDASISKKADALQAPSDVAAAAGKSLLTKLDLESHFSYSLSEAAKRLGVSNTTVKRACRLVAASLTILRLAQWSATCEQTLRYTCWSHWKIDKYV